jgi:hypothetical protein
VNPAAFSGEGRLAFVSQETLWVLDGTGKPLQQVRLPAGVVPLEPSFSPDGKWLAFVTGSTSLARGSLWMSAADGLDPHRIAGLVIGNAFGWDPRADLYAVATGPISRRAPFGQPTTVRLVSPDGSWRTVADAPAIVGAAWSPDGSALAVSTESHAFTPSLTSYDVRTGRPTGWRGVPHARGDFVVPTGWWSGQGIGYTVIAYGAVPDGEGSFSDAPLFAVSSSVTAPRFLGETLTNDSPGEPTATVRGELAFVNDTGFPRAIWDGKQVEVCAPGASTCSAVPAPAGDVTEDPVWSASGGTLAYVAGPDLGSDGYYSPANISAWYDAHTLLLHQPSTGIGTDVTAAHGATVPEWSETGRSLLYVADDGLWLLRSVDAAPVEIAHPLYSSGPVPSYYGEVDWAQQFSWSVGAGTAPCYVVCNPSM